MLTKTLFRLMATITLMLTLTACNLGDRLTDFGGPPTMTKIQDPRKDTGFQSVRLPMPRPEPVVRQANSLWRPGARAFFKDQRANRVGDILTIEVDISDSAQLSNTTNRERESAEDADLTQFLGFQAQLNKVLPDTVDPANLLSFGNKSKASGTGSVDRNETVEMKIAALVVDILPNGNLVVAGRQEIRVNFEVREVLISGIVRPEDITATNTVQHSQIAEARIAYGGRGQLTDVQQARYGQQLYDILMPF